VNSMDAADYRKTKGTDSFEMVRGNIRYLSEFVRENALPTRLIVSRVESEDERYDAGFVSFWKESGLVHDAFIRSYHDYNRLIGEPADAKERVEAPCRVHWTRFNIDVDGKAVVCFNELFRTTSVDADLVVGDVSSQSIGAIWKGPRLSEIRRAAIAKDYRGLDCAAGFPCEGCRCLQPLGTTKRTSEHQIAQIPGR
jgi:hypothetical protein